RCFYRLQPFTGHFQSADVELEILGTSKQLVVRSLNSDSDVSYEVFLTDGFKSIEHAFVYENGLPTARLLFDDLGDTDGHLYTD
ncbi:hypothetical protein HDU88_008414, partial [Geranomyces variabilis]